MVLEGLKLLLRWPSECFRLGLIANILQVYVSWGWKTLIPPVRDHAADSTALKEALSLDTFLRPSPVSVTVRRSGSKQILPPREAA